MYYLYKTFIFYFALNSIVFGASATHSSHANFSAVNIHDVKIIFPALDVLKKKWQDRKELLENGIKEGRIQDPNGNIRRWIDYVESTDALMRFNQSLDLRAFFLKSTLIRSDYIKNIKKITHHWHMDQQYKSSYQTDVRFNVFDYYYNHSKITTHWNRNHSNWFNRDDLHHTIAFVASNVLDQEASAFADDLVSFLIEEQPRHVKNILSEIAYDYFIRGDDFERALKKAAHGHLIID